MTATYILPINYYELVVAKIITFRSSKSTSCLEAHYGKSQQSLYESQNNDLPPPNKEPEGIYQRNQKQLGLRSPTGHIKILRFFPIPQYTSSFHPREYLIRDTQRNLITQITAISTTWTNRNRLQTFLQDPLLRYSSKFYKKARNLHQRHPKIHTKNCQH